MNAFPEQKKVCSKEEVPHQVPLRRAAHHQPPALHEGMHAVFVSVFWGHLQQLCLKNE